MDNCSKASNSLVVAAIDIGTSYSGYAFAFRADFIRDPCDIKTNQWPDNKLSHKTSTVILFNQNMSFNSFGHEAEEKFTELAENGTSLDYFYFHEFKMNLYKTQELGPHTLINDIHGKPFPIMGLFTEAIRYLKKHILQQFETRLQLSLNVTIDEIHYVISVPAIWSDAAKQLMLKAAVQAGIKEEHVELAYEPEAAALYCKHMNPEKLTGNKRKSMFSIGKPYIVVDMGGGTADVTVQRVSHNGKVDTVHKATGGAYGGTNINKAFMELFISLFGEPLFLAYCRENMGDFVDLIKAIELKKRKVSLDENESIILQLPFLLVQKYMEKTKGLLKDAIQNAKLQDFIVEKTGFKIQVKNRYFHSVFHNTCSPIVQLVHDIIHNVVDCDAITSLILVGGFSESIIVQDIFKKRFPNFHIRIPMDAGLAVLKGAVIYGFDSSIVQSRICPFSYGIAVLKKYDPNKHDLSKSFYDGEHHRVDDCFEKIFEVSEQLVIGEKRSIPVHKLHTTEDQQKWRYEYKEIELYSSSLRSPKYVTDPECKKHGVILVPPPDGVWPEETIGDVEVQVAGSETFKIQYVDKKTNHTTSGTINFMLAAEECSQ